METSIRKDGQIHSSGERTFWNEKIETMSQDELRALQLKRLREQVKYNYQYSTFYRDKFNTCGMVPDDIETFEDFQKVPLMTKDEHRRTQEESLEKYGHPYGIITCAPQEKIVRINSTSGTTGTPTLYTLTRHDVAVVNELHARKFWRSGLRPNHVIIQALSLSMFTGGLPLSEGLMHLGASVVPVGIEAGTQRVLQFIELTSANAIIATPSFGEYLIEKTPKYTGKDARDLGIRLYYCAGEPGGGNPETRKRLSEGFNAKVFDNTGGGHAFHGMSCDEPPEQYSGMHFTSEDHCLLELVHPETKAPVDIKDGATGEMVFTFLDWEGGPFMRYALGDILEVYTRPCACGMPGIRFKIMGRADDMLIVKGVNIYPGSIKNAVDKFFPRTTGALRILLDKPGPLVSPPLRIRLEHSAGMDTASIGVLEEEMVSYFKDNLRIRPKFIWVPHKTIPRETGKVKLVEIVDSANER
ncbi:MAG: AMP-binding protein [Desulfobacteraceae bacterium]|nr:AMP-binding protein [Desulfobacteraceae bacterium]